MRRPTPPDAPASNLIADVFPVEDDDMAPAYNDGDVLFLGPPTCNLADIRARLVGRDCVVRLDDARTLVRRIELGAGPDRLTLEAVAAETLRDITVVAAAPVVWVKKGVRDASDT